MKTQRIKHPHIYRRVKHGKGHVYRCMHPGCTHYLRKEFLEGQVAKCPDCGNVFVIGKYQLRLVDLHCDDCTKRDDKNVEKLKELFG